MRVAFYPWLLCAAPLIHLYSANASWVNGGEALAATAVCLGLTTAAYHALRLLSAKPQKAALTTAIGSLFFLLFGSVADLLGSSKAALGLLFAGAGMLTVQIWRRDSSKQIETLVPLLNVAAISFFALPFIRIVPIWREARTLAATRPVRADLRSSTPRAPDAAGKPDIYYIILDGYPSNAFLLRRNGYDNSSFTRKLEELGFFVASESRSNYGNTLLSLASSLNMEYVNSNKSSPRISDTLYLRTLIADNRVGRFLQERGYTYVYVNSGYLLISDIADVVIDVNGRGTFDPRSTGESFNRFRYLRIGSFYQLALETTPLRAFRAQLAPLPSPDTPLPWHAPQRFSATMGTLREVARRPQATFAFVHLTVPHLPVRFNADGTYASKLELEPTRKQFFEQLEFVNRSVLAVLESILKSSASDPIIVVQADHGSDLGRLKTSEGRFTHFEILNALRLPGARPERIGPKISPINTFRVILSTCFGAGLEDLPVRHYDCPRHYVAPFELVEVERPD